MGSTFDAYEDKEEKQPTSSLPKHIDRQTLLKMGVGEQHVSKLLSGRGGGSGNSGGDGAGSGGGSGPQYEPGKSKFAMAMEDTGSGYVSVGTEGAIHQTPYGKTTLHRDGAHHHHRLHSRKPKSKKGSFWYSDKLYSPKYQELFGSLSAMFKRINKKK